MIVNPGALRGAMRVPPSKSAAHRALIAAALADAPTRVRLGALNRDIEATLNCLRALGAAVKADGDVLRVSPIPRRGISPSLSSSKSLPPMGKVSAKQTDEVPCSLFPEAALLDCGESGSTLRFMLPVAAALGARARIVGHGRLPQRPNAPLTDALRAHGAAIDGDLLPMNLSGGLRGGLWTLPGNVSSQYITGLLFALPLLDDDSEIALTTPLESAAYVNMTLQTLSRFGVEVAPTPSGWRIPGGQRYHSPGEIDVEGDWSAAAFWLAANALGAEIELSGLRDDTAQGDRAALWLVGRPEIDASNVPDLVPALAVAAAGRPGRTVVTGAARLRLKESDRLESVAKLLAALGHRAEVTGDGLIIEGGPPEPADAAVRTVDGANDHRIVMAAAVAAAFADAPVRITDAGAVAKSYPDFFRDFNELGGHAYVEPAGQ